MTSDNPFLLSTKTCLKKFATFSGRATRQEYWYFVLFTVILTAICAIIGYLLGSSKHFNADFLCLPILPPLLLALPGVAAGCRRYHDAGLKGWLHVLLLIIGLFLLLIVAVFAANALDAAGSRPFEGNIGDPDNISNSDLDSMVADSQLVAKVFFVAFLVPFVANIILLSKKTKK